jgi:hypothetical protein
MFAFRLTHKDGCSVLAGAPDLGLLSIIVSAVGRLGSESQGSRGLTDGFYIDLDVTGSTARANIHENESLIWHRSKTNIGDAITIEVLESEHADEPARRRSVKADRAIVALPMRRRHSRRRRGEYRRRHSSLRPHHDD